MKKKLVLVILSTLIATNVFATVFVNDFMHMLETIHNGFQIYQQIQNEIKQLEYQYESTKAQLKSLQQLDPSEIDSFSDAVEMVDDNLTFLRNTEQTLTSYQITMGNGSYSLADIYKIPGGVYSEINDSLTSNLSDEDKARIWSYYGLDPKNYYYTQTWKKRINDASQQLNIMAQQVKDKAAENKNKEKEFADSVKNTEGIVGQQQLTNNKLSELGKNLDYYSYNIAQTGDLIASTVQANTYIEPEIGVSEDFTEKDDDPEPIVLEGIY